MNFFKRTPAAKPVWWSSFFLSFFASVGVFFAPSATQSSVNTGKTTNHSVEEIFLPAGFDDNDDVVVMVYGVYDMSCEEMVSHSYEIDDSNNVIYLDSKKVVHEAKQDCTENFEPFYKEYNLGTLPAAEYKVVARGDSPVVDTLQVQASRIQDRDRFDYPEMVEIRIALKATGRASLYLDVPLENSCQRLQSVSVQRRSSNFWEVYPIMSQTQRGDCEKGLLIQTKEVDLGEIPIDTHIFYIRTKQGESNFYFEALI